MTITRDSIGPPHQGAPSLKTASGWHLHLRNSAAWSKCAKSRQNAMWGRITFHSTEILHKKIVQILVLQMMKGKVHESQKSLFIQRRKGLKYHSDMFTADKKICNDFNNRHTFNYDQFSIIKIRMRSPPMDFSLNLLSSREGRYRCRSATIRTGYCKLIS